MLHLSLSLTLPLLAVLHQLTAAVKGYHDSQPVSAVENKGIHSYLQAPLVHILLYIGISFVSFFSHLTSLPLPFLICPGTFFPPSFVFSLYLLEFLPLFA